MTALLMLPLLRPTAFLGACVLLIVFASISAAQIGGDDAFTMPYRGASILLPFWVYTAAIWVHHPEPKLASPAILAVLAGLVLTLTLLATTSPITQTTKYSNSTFHPAAIGVFIALFATVFVVSKRRTALRIGLPHWSDTPGGVFLMLIAYPIGIFFLGGFARQQQLIR
jgi:hypothetical protein